jgi:nondiscriminating aspartyl-tRNA synthetase
MERIYSSELVEHVGERVLLAGWVHARRELGGVSFLVLRDRSGLAQVVLEGPVAFVPESVVEIEGIVMAAEQAPGGVELCAAQVNVLAEPAERPPLELRRPELKETLPMILDHAPLALRHPQPRARFEVAAASLYGFRAALDRLGFTELSTPKIVASATESGANVFALDYFGRRAYLAQSPQFYKQTMVGVFERVYETGPVFRAELHDTARHLSEYTSLDAEIGFVRDHFDVMAVARVAVAGMVEAVRELAPRAVELLEVELPQVPLEIPWLHFADSGVDDVDLAPADERRLCEEHGEFVFITGFPMAKRPFYTHPEPGRSQYSNSFDLLFRGMEIVTGGQRLHRYEDMWQRSAAQRPRTRATYRRSAMACLPTAASRSGLSAGWPAWSARPTSARRHCSRAT